MSKEDCFYPSHAAQLGPIAVDFEYQTGCFGSMIKHLMPREIQILYVLSREPGFMNVQRIIDDLLRLQSQENCGLYRQHKNSTPTYKSVRILISNINKKFGPIIDNRPREGYQFASEKILQKIIK